MVFRRKIPLAWKNLTHDLRRLATAASGIGFAVFLMFIETGFKHALFDSTVELINVINADLVMVGKSRFAMVSIERFDRRRLDQVRSMPGVADAYPLFVETQMATVKKIKENGYPIRVIAYELDTPIFDGTEVAEMRHLMSKPNTAIVDTRTKLKYGLRADSVEQLRDYHVELENRQVHLVGNFTLGTDFSTDGSLIMSAQNYARFFPYASGGLGDPLSKIDLGIIKLDENARHRVAEVKSQLLQVFAHVDDVDIYTKTEFMDREKAFWNRNTPVAFVFAVGTVMGFIVGTVICYQIIFTDITDHMPEFATLKAMGYDNSYFLGLIVKEALFLSVIGFIPGLLASGGVYWLLAEWTGLLLRLTVPRTLMVFGLTSLMCVVSGCLAIRKIVSADPAELF